MRNNPETPVSVLMPSLVSPDHAGAIAESLGAEAIAGHLNGVYGGGVSVSHVDLQLDPDVKRLKQKIASEKPDILGISVKIGSHNQLESILQDIDVPPLLVLGGVVPTFAGPKLIEKYPNAIVVVGEGEPAASALVEVVRGGRELETVPGIMFLRGGELVVTQRERLDLSDRHLPARLTTKRIHDERKGLIWAEASRGCEGTCTFCSVREIHDGGFNGDIPIDSIIDDLLKLKSLGVNLVSYTDDDFCGDVDRATIIAERIAAEVPGVTFSISTRADHIWVDKLPRGSQGSLTVEQYNSKLLRMVRKLKQAGLIRVFVGLESGSRSQLKRYGKHISLESNYKAVEILRQEGIDVVAGYIPIDHLMTLKELQENLEFLRKTGMWAGVTNPLSVLRVQAGSPYLNLMKRNDLLGSRTDDLVFYEADFTDPQVEVVARLANEWVDRDYEIKYGLKNEAARNSNGYGGDDDAQSASDFMLALKDLEMRYIENIVESGPDHLNGNGAIGAITEKFIEEQKSIFSQVAQAVEVGSWSSNNLLTSAVRAKF